MACTSCKDKKKMEQKRTVPNIDNMTNYEKKIRIKLIKKHIDRLIARKASTDEKIQALEEELQILESDYLKQIRSPFNEVLKD